jgi:hypothetical protein
MKVLLVLTYLDLKRIWNPIDFQGERSRSQGPIFRRGDTPRFALPLFENKIGLKFNVQNKAYNIFFFTLCKTFLIISDLHKDMSVRKFIRY